MADTEYCKIILYKFNHTAGLSCDPETLEQIGEHQPATSKLFLSSNIHVVKAEKLTVVKAEKLTVVKAEILTVVKAEKLTVVKAEKLSVVNAKKLTFVKAE